MTLKKVERTITGFTVILGILIILGFLIRIASELMGTSVDENPGKLERIWAFMILMFSSSVALTFTLNIAVLSRYFRRFVEEYSKHLPLSAVQEEPPREESPDD